MVSLGYAEYMPPRDRVARGEVFVTPMVKWRSLGEFEPLFQD